jgi:membrane protein implicated in regulation of membrane protease activity
MGNIFLLSLVAAANATLLAAVTVMLFLPSPKRLLLGFLLGALLISLTTGFVIVFAVHHSSATSTAQNSLSPSMDIALGLIALLVAYVLHGGHDERLKRRRKKKDEGAEKSPSKVEQLLGRGSARVTFAVGVVLTLPGVAYLAALRDLDEMNYGTVPKILVILGFNVMLLLLLEIPLLGYALAPERTVVEVQRFRAWLSRSGRRIAIIGAAGIGAFLLARGVIELLT